MQIALHAGVHATDEGRLLKCLSRNGNVLGPRGIAVPPFGSYRILLRDAIAAVVSGHSPAHNARAVLLDGILAGTDHADEPDRLILSNQNFFSNAGAAMREGILYRAAEARLSAMEQLFPRDEIELFIGIRNPATFLPTVQSAGNTENVDAFLGGADPLSIRWSDFILRLRHACPRVSITVWCNEDTPLIWGSLLREIASIEPNLKITGAFDLLSDIMTQEGMKRFRTYLAEHPVMTEMQKRRVISAFLDKFAKEDEIEEEIAAPGWSPHLLADMTEAYEEDLYHLERIPGVNFLSP
jgi:hypothetical protein